MKQFYKMIILMVMMMSGLTLSVKAEDFHVSFEFEGDGADSYITSVTANDEVVPDFKNGFDVPDNTNVQMAVADKNDNIKVLVNGEEPIYISYIRTYSFQVTRDTIVKVVSSKPAENPISITVDVNDRQAVEFGYISILSGLIPLPQSIEIPLEKDGVNKVTMPNTKVNQVYVKAREGYTLKSVKADGTEVANPGDIAITEGMTLVIEAAKSARLSYTIKCEDFSHIQVNDGAGDLQLTSNEQTFTFLEGTEVSLTITASQGYEITGVKLDGEPVDGGMQFHVTGIKDGSVIEIDTKKLATYHVSFEFEGEGANSYITTVSVDYNEIPDFKNGFDAPVNTMVQMGVAKENKDIKVLVNGSEATYSPYSACYSFTLTENTVVKVVAAKPMSINVDVDNFKAVEFGYISILSGIIPVPQSIEIPLEKDGVNKVTMPNTKVNQVYVKAREGYALKSVKADGSEVANPEDIAIAEGMTLVIVTEELAKSSYTVKCDDYNHVILNNGTEDIQLTSNDQTILFSAGSEVTLTIKPAEGYNITGVKLDGTPVEGGPEYTVTGIKEGSVVEIESEAVKMFSVKFEFDNTECEDYIQGVDAGTDMVADFKEGFEAPEGTLIMLKRSEELDPNFVVTVNGEVVTFDRMFRNYSFTLTENTVIKVTNTKSECIMVDVNIAAFVEVGWTENAPVAGLPGTRHTFELNDGNNEVSLPAGCQEIYVIPAPMSSAIIKSVILNGMTVDSDNYASIPVSNGDKITIEADNASSLADVIAHDENVKVYDLSGNQMIVRNGVNNLPKGIYLINGRKVMIK